MKEDETAQDLELRVETVRQSLLAMCGHRPMTVRVALLAAGLILSGADAQFPSPGARDSNDPDYPTGPPRVVRYGTSVQELARRAFEETRGLAGC